MVAQAFNPNTPGSRGGRISEAGLVYKGSTRTTQKACLRRGGARENEEEREGRNTEKMNWNKEKTKLSETTIKKKKTRLV